MKPSYFVVYFSVLEIRKEKFRKHHEAAAWQKYDGVAVLSYLFSQAIN